VLLLEMFPDGVEELDGAYAVYADEPPIGFDVLEAAEVGEGWEDAWREFHHGVRVGSIWVGPPWETVAIDPGRAFGTGSHPTTRLTLELLQTLARGSVLDIGCGSGVLSIAAAKLGFAPIVAVDIDPIAVEVTRENARANGVDVRASVFDALEGELPAADVVVANVALDVVEALLPRLRAARAVTSGYLASERPQSQGWHVLDRREADGWAADVLAFG
jgi:ribosomal protein L11 methyltransferase